MGYNKCKDCRWFSPELLVCFHDANEGMRVFYGGQKACEWFNRPLLNLYFYKEVDND